ncbi:hypothetical protein [Stenotrophomonas sp. PS02289]|uniref:hypothetical protein n=1 Tax=Stenotrophomonas sp. PS02289 TaxID=2991422 RepID=UPI00249A9431|nr:hypothetical protein [Stenotrophomonas sp. PS02289]
MSAPTVAPPSLPLPLQPWRQWLEGFDAEIVAALGEWLLRLAPLLGNGSARVQAPSPEPDGLGELASRGQYQRLLLSEWGLADLAPDEFLRRAANGEHLFLAPTPIRPRSDPRMVMVFDAGPAQWGDARLVHVALWILLWRHAQAQRAQLQWGLAHLPGELHSVETPQDLLKMLRGRTHAVAESSHWLAWHAVLQPSSPHIGERWCIGGGQGVSGDAGFTHAARIHTGWDAQLQVRMGPRAALRTLALPRLAAAPAARLLAGEFLHRPARADSSSAKGRFSLRQPPLFSPNGRSVAVALAGRNGAFQLRLPEPGQRKVYTGRYHEWAAQSQMLAATTWDKVFGGITCDADHLYFWKLQGQSTQPRPEPEVFTVRPGVPQWLPIALLYAGGKRHSVAVIDHARQLLVWPAPIPGDPASKRGPLRVAGDVLALHQANPQGVVYARVEGIYVGIHQLDSRGNSSPRARLLATDRTRAVWFGGTQRGSGFQTCCVEHRDLDGLCVLTLYDAGCGQVGLAKLPVDWKRIGLIQAGNNQGVWQMLVLRADRRTLVAVGTGIQTVIHTSSDDIMAASVSDCGRRIAVLGMGGELLVLALGTDPEAHTVLARVRGTGDEHAT